LTTAKNHPEPSKEDAAEARRAFEELTEAAHTLLSSGETEIYSETYESVARVLKRLLARKEKQERELRAKLAAQQNKKKEIHWQYKWNPEDKEVHGPFVASEMQEWKVDGYFAGNAVAQRVGPGHPAGVDMDWIQAKSVVDFTR